MIKISVILPIYNVAPYLDETFQSIINQTLKDIEIIAVNDGSTDDCEDIIRNYQEKDSRIIYISQNNQGVATTRNVALQHAKGDYIYMMDADDILYDPQALECAYNYAKCNSADFIFFDSESFSEKGIQRTSWNTKRTHMLEENHRYKGEFLLDMMLDSQKHNCVVWLLLINRHYLEKTELKFYPGIIHEDELFTTILTLKSNNIYCLKQSLIKHRIRSNSIMGQKFSRRNIDCYLTVIDELLKFQDSHITKKFAKYTLSRIFYTGHIIPLKDKITTYWRAVKSGYLKYIGIKSSLVFWLK